MFRSSRAAVEAVVAGSAGVAFVGLLLLSPWAYGGVENRFRAWAAVILAACAAAAGLVQITRRRTTAGVVLLALLPLLGFLALCEAQLAGGLIPVGAAGTLIPPGTIYPAETRLALAGLLAVTAAALVGGVLFSNGTAFRGLLFVCLVGAACVAFGGIALRLAGEDRVIRGMAVVGDPFARFVNRNNAAAFLQLGIAAGLALIRSTLRTDQEDEKAFRPSVDRRTVLAMVAAMLALCFAGIAASRSRGGIVAAVVTLAVGAALFRGRSPVARIVLSATPVAAATVLLAWLGLSSATLDRFESLSLEQMLSEGRIPHWREALRAAVARPAFGSGLGTYGYAYQEFSTSPTIGWHVHADNQLVELLVEAGAAGAAVLAGGAALLAVGLIRGGGRPVERVLLASLVSGQAAHAVFDYGIVVPAVALSAAALWAAGLVRLLAMSEGRPPVAGHSFSQIALFGVAVFTAGGLVWAYGEYRSAWAIDRAVAAAGRLDSPGGLDPEDLDRAIDRLTAAVQARPDAAAGQRALADLYVYRYRTKAAAGLRRLDVTLSANDAWAATGLTALHRALNGLARLGAAAGIEGMRRDSLVQRNLIPARRHYLSAATACPRLPGVRLPLASLAFVELGGDPAGISEIEAAAELFPADPDVQRTAGRLAWQAGRRELAEDCWRRAFRLSPRGYVELIDDLAPVQGYGAAVVAATPREAGALLGIARDRNVRRRPAIRRALAGLLTEAAEAEGAATSVEAAAAWYRGELDRAAVLFEEALQRSPRDADLWFDSARLDRERGRVEDGFDKLYAALVLEPGRDDFLTELRAWKRSEDAGSASGAATGSDR